MPEQVNGRFKTIWRLASGLLALVSLGIAALRLYGLAVAGPAPDASYVTSLFGVLFPLVLGLLFGFVAITGKMPGASGK